ncbi:MAG: hypothetical protein ABIR46_04740 [Candidatus Saccharimonadales bacterium]
MKMVSLVLAVLLSTTLLLSGNVYAADDCAISGTGPGSTNECVVERDCSIDISNDTDIDINNDSDQTSESGDSEVDGNTSGGNASSGGSSNTNSTEVGVEIVNGGASCEAVVPTTPTTPTTPEGGRGAGQVSGASTVAGGRGAGAQQVAAPVGGVGAGAGGMVLPAVFVSLLTAAVGARRLYRSVYA